jgi:hypothetical protein
MYFINSGTLFVPKYLMFDFLTPIFIFCLVQNMKKSNIIYFKYVYEFSYFLNILNKING